MTDEFGEPRRDRREASRTDLASLLVDAFRALRNRPVLAFPFLAVAATAAIGDAIRLADRVPTTLQTTAQRGFTHLVLHVAPGVTSAVGTRPAALLGLKTGPLVGIVITDGLPFVLTAVATVLTISWLLGDATPLTARELVPRTLRLLGYNLAVLAALFVLGTAVGSLGVFSFVLLVGLLVATVRLFVVPAGLARGRSLGASISASLRLTRGHGWTLFGFVVVLGVTANLLVSLPVLIGGLSADPSVIPVGTAVATACVGTLHALLVGLVSTRLT